MRKGVNLKHLFGLESRPLYVVVQLKITSCMRYGQLLMLTMIEAGYPKSKLTTGDAQAYPEVFPIPLPVLLEARVGNVVLCHSEGCV
jgi:hypothetical protein